MKRGAATTAAFCLTFAACHSKTDHGTVLSAAEYTHLRAEVASVVDRFGRMWEDEDMTTFDEIIAHDNDLLVVGTDAGERIVGFDAYRDSRSRQYAAFENVEFDVLRRDIKVSVDGTAAWFAEEFNLFLLARGQPVSLEGLRVTGGLEKRDDRWVIVQLHFSVPIQGQAAEY